MAEGMPEDQKTLARRLRNQLRTKSQRKRIIEDPRCSITSDPEFVDGTLDLGEKEEFKDTIHLTIENTGPNALYLLSCIVLGKLNNLTLKDEHNVTRKNPLSLNPGDSYDTEATYRCSSFGCHETVLAFEFRSLESTFHIVRVIVARCMTTLGKDLAPKDTYSPRPYRAPVSQGVRLAMNGQRPTCLLNMLLEYEDFLGQYKIPPKIRSQADSSTFPSGRDKQILGNPLSWKTYSKKFELLLYLEELEMEADMRKYSTEMTNKQMVREGNLLVLKVPGVSEKRPSVLRGDEVLVNPVGKPWTKYRVFVDSVQQDSVKLSFHQALLDLYTKDMKFDVEFLVSRLSLRIRHRAAAYATKCQLEPVLFPSAPPPSNKKPPLPELSELFDELLQGNPEQARAVKHIVAGSSKPAPYVVYGPPGTGKTETLAMAIVQLEKTKKNCHILACAQTNNAADALCSMILKWKSVAKSKVYRMYATTVNVKCVPAELKECSNLEGNSYVYPPKAKLMEYRIVVTTLLTAGRFVAAKVPNNHFTHVFVDEAGQAMEPECIVPLAGLLNVKSGQVVLAGDPEQLGPIVRSRLAQKYGLEVSLIERLKDFHLYQRDRGDFDERFVTKLLQNYRSHFEILKVPKELFYDDELKPFATDCDSYCNWEGLLQRVMKRDSLGLCLSSVHE